MYDEKILTAADLDVLEWLRAQPGPFTTAYAREAGATYPRLREWVRAGLLVHPVRGIYHSPHVSQTLSFRVEALKLIVPEDSVVTDRTAGWLWGANMILAPGDHLATPRVSVFCPPGNRLRNLFAASGERMLSRGDVADVDGLRVTTPLRTACDLGRLLHRQQALAALDSLLGTGRFTRQDLALETLRFKGYRGVVQLRHLGPLADPRSASPGESGLRLHWYDAGLPRPECQIEVPAPHGGSWWLDMGLRAKRFAAEFDGEAFHGEDRREHDDSRRGFLRDPGGWTIVVARAHNVYGRRQDADRLLRTAYEALK